MSKIIKNTVLIILCMTIFATTFSSGFTSSAASELDRLRQQSNQIASEISKLKKEKASQQAILAAVQKKIANTQAQVRACNNQINAINAKINANKAEIDKNNAEIEDTKLELKKRLRAIYMSNSDSSVKILLGAENFAEYLQLAQMTDTVSKHDKTIIEKIVETVKVLEEKNKENEKLLEDQVAVRNTVKSALEGLEAEEAEAKKIYNSISSEQSSAEADKQALDKLIKQKEAALYQPPPSSITKFQNSKLGFVWPVPGFYNVTSGFGARWGTTHRGIDISSGGIYGKPIVAITDGEVYRTYSACPHRGVTPRCSCGSGWGNHVGVYHGKMSDGKEYYAMYAHMDSLASGIYVGKTVKQGEVLGYVGTTGDSTGYHLHFGISINGTSNWVNPMNYFS